VALPFPAPTPAYTHEEIEPWYVLGRVCVGPGLDVWRRVNSIPRRKQALELDRRLCGPHIRSGRLAKSRLCTSGEIGASTYRIGGSSGLDVWRGGNSVPPDTQLTA
jgi:hypothetical protein